MKADLLLISNIFVKYNNIIFKGELPLPRFALSKAKTFVGRMSWKRNPFTRKYDYTLRVNSVIDFTENQIRDIVVHEMIHYFISYKKYEDTSAHGKVFKTMVEQINKEFGLNVQTSFHLDEDQQRQSVTTKKGKRFVFAIRIKDGTTGFKVVPAYEDDILKYNSFLKNADQIKSYALFHNYGTEFSSYRGSMSGRINVLDEDRLKEKLLGSLLFEVKGKELVFIKRVSENNPNEITF